MDKRVLSKIELIRKEIKDLKDKLESINKKPVKIVTDSVKGSSTTYPYIEHNCVVEGIDEHRVILNKRNRNKYKKLIKSKELKLEKMIIKLEYELNYIEDKYSDIRQIIRYKYEDNLNWVQIMFKMDYNNEDTARKKLERFLEKF